MFQWIGLLYLCQRPPLVTCGMIFGVGDMAFRRDYIFIIWSAFNIKRGSCDVMPSPKGFLFRLRGDVVNSADLLLSRESINSLTFVSWSWRTYIRAENLYTHSLMYLGQLHSNKVSINPIVSCIQVWYP